MGCHLWQLTAFISIGKCAKAANQSGARVIVTGLAKPIGFGSNSEFVFKKPLNMYMILIQNPVTQKDQDPEPSNSKVLESGTQQLKMTRILKPINFKVWICLCCKCFYLQEQLKILSPSLKRRDCLLTAVTCMKLHQTLKKNEVSTANSTQTFI